MPAIWLFPSADKLPTAKALTEFLKEQMGMPATVAEKKGEGPVVHYTLTISPEEGAKPETGHVRAAAVLRTERDEEAQQLVDEVVGQAAELQEVFDGNVLDVTVEFDDTETDSFAGCVIAYAFGSLFECGLLVTDLPKEPLDDEEEEEDDEEGMTVSCWYDDAEEFADDFFMDEDSEDDLEDEDEEYEDEEGDDEDEEDDKK
ncbi:MAG: hypothetical protein SF028_13120 [Candidatus Sumerlaeia bacterium]|nr:hypothetical protein [Candidatus Sumerlaeia bacterium]